MSRKKSARDKLREHFEAHVGEVLGKDELREVAGISEWARRVRELRDEEGMQIRTSTDREDLKPGEYVLESLERLPGIGRSVPPGLRSKILERNGYTCQLCGAGAGDPDPCHPGRKVRLHVDHIVPASQGGRTEEDNLMVTCSACNQGKMNIQSPSESAKNLIARIRKQPRAVQREVYEYLEKAFGCEGRFPGTEEYGNEEKS